MEVRRHAGPILLLIALLTLAALPLAAQTRAGASLEARMEAFLDEVPREPSTALAAFFPRRGDWTWVRTIRDDERGGPDRTGVWRFPGAETVRAIGAGGPVCDSFDEGDGHFGPFEGRFGMQMRMHPGPWRRLGGNRFVPPGASASSPVFVEWRREDGQWVVSAFGDLDIYFPHLLGVERSTISRDTLLADEGAYAAGEPWFAEYRRITLEGWPFTRSGVSPPVERRALTLIGAIGRVPVYAPGRETAEPGMLLIPMGPGEYALYEGWRPSPCH